MSIENYYEILKFKFDNITINVQACEKNQINMYDKNGVLYCEEPICSTECNNITATCIPGEIKDINDPRNNICKCLPGYEGTKCEKRIFDNLRLDIIIFRIFNII